MGTTVLIMVWLVGINITTLTAEFNTQAACDNASRGVQQGLGFRTDANATKVLMVNLCIPKG